MHNPIRYLYDYLHDRYGPQGWWPLFHAPGQKRQARGDDEPRYHHGDFSYPRTRLQRFEICLGAILTQNTSWRNVVDALRNLRRITYLQPKRIVDTPRSSLITAIVPARYYNQKSRYVCEFTHWFLRQKKQPTRDELLARIGVGNETADSMLLYAFTQPEFVVDAYTRRIAVFLGQVRDTARYDDIKQCFRERLKADVPVFQEYHALLVEHAKQYYVRKPWGENDPLREKFCRR